MDDVLFNGGRTKGYTFKRKAHTVVVTVSHCSAFYDRKAVKHEGMLQFVLSSSFPFLSLFNKWFSLHIFSLDIPFVRWKWHSVSNCKRASGARLYCNNVFKISSLKNVRLTNRGLWFHWSSSGWLCCRGYETKAFCGLSAHRWAYFSLILLPLCFLTVITF